MRLQELVWAYLQYVSGFAGSLQLVDKDGIVPLQPFQPSIIQPEVTVEARIKNLNIPSDANVPQLNEHVLNVSSNIISGGTPVIKSINAYRSRANLPPLVWDDRLAANAAKTGQATNGKAMVHQLNPGTNGQVLIEGVDDPDICGSRDISPYTPFELFYLSWLCEVPDDKALEGKCDPILRKSHIDNQGQVGHWQILSDRKYKKIGCAFTRNPEAKRCAYFTGIWACDLGL